MKNGDPDWLLLFPMVKSAVRAMDVLQEVSRRKLDTPFRKFVVAGASKRGWTTWLTASQDTRVAGIAPMVIDVLNMQKQMPYQKEVWGDYSRKISDYENAQAGGESFLDLLGSPKGQQLTSLVDPYAYREKLTIPKFIFIGTNDPYWPVDAVKHYRPDLPGRTAIHYVANAGHGLADGIGSAGALAAFTGAVAGNSTFPRLSWETKENGAEFVIRVSADAPMRDARLWTAKSDDRDFRDEKFKSTNREVSEGRVTAAVQRPENGYRATYVDVVFQSPAGGTYTQSTRMFVLGPQK
jgi:PhoPQ-activated pathogenicity-related protein